MKKQAAVMLLCCIMLLLFAVGDHTVRKGPVEESWDTTAAGDTEALVTEQEETPTSSTSDTQAPSAELQPPSHSPLAYQGPDSSQEIESTTDADVSTSQTSRPVEPTAAPRPSPRPIPIPVVPTPPTETQPSGGTSLLETPIMGDNVLTAQRLAEFYRRVQGNIPPKLTGGCTILQLAQYFLEEGKREGVRGDIAFMQAILETGWFQFQGSVGYEQNNYCGLGAVNQNAAGTSFASPRMGARAQIQHLKAYGSAAPLNSAQVDPRFHLVARGIAPRWTDLNGRWAVPGNGYGEKILALYERAITF